MDEPAPSRSWLARLGWLCLYWIVGVATMAVAVWLLKLVLRAVGLQWR